MDVSFREVWAVAALILEIRAAILCTLGSNPYWTLGFICMWTCREFCAAGLVQQCISQTVSHKKPHIDSTNLKSAQKSKEK